MIDPNELERLSNPREALEEAFKVVFGPKPGTIWKDEVLREEWTDEYSAWFARSCRFYTLLDAEAYIDAALMLIGPDRWLEFKGPRKYLNIPTPVPAAWSAHIAKWNHGGDVVGWGDTLAEAIAQACLKARENSDG